MCINDSHRLLALTRHLNMQNKMCEMKLNILKTAVPNKMQPVKVATKML